MSYLPISAPLLWAVRCSREGLQHLCGFVVCLPREEPFNQFKTAGIYEKNMLTIQSEAEVRNFHSNTALLLAQRHCRKQLQVWPLIMWADVHVEWKALNSFVLVSCDGPPNPWNKACAMLIGSWLCQTTWSGSRMRSCESQRLPLSTVQRIQFQNNDNGIYTESICLLGDIAWLFSSQQRRLCSQPGYLYHCDDLAQPDWKNASANTNSNHFEELN